MASAHICLSSSAIKFLGANCNCTSNALLQKQEIMNICYS